MLVNLYGIVPFGQIRRTLVMRTDLFCTIDSDSLLFTSSCWSVKMISPSNNPSDSSKMEGGGRRKRAISIFLVSIV